MADSKPSDNTNTDAPILPSDRGSGVYECDLCRRDVSLGPRLRCGPDFDVCVDCLPQHRRPYRVADSLQYPLLGSRKDTVVFCNNGSVWTAQDDLRLLRGIELHGLANWTDIAEVVGTKSPRKCMERYWDDFMGIYGKVLPPMILKETQEPQIVATANDASLAAALEAAPARASKRRQSNRPNVPLVKRYFVGQPVEQPDFWKMQKAGQVVGRDAALKAEQAYCKAAATVENSKELEALREALKPPVAPPRVQDVATMPGAELAGFMPRRGDLDVEWDNAAEDSIADMEFLPHDTSSERKLKLQVLQIYNRKLKERTKRKQFLLTRKLYQPPHDELPPDERDLVQRMRLVERFHTPKEHRKFLNDILKAKRLRKEICQLQTLRRMGIRTLSEATQYTLDKERHALHKAAHASAASTAIIQSDSVGLWKQYTPRKRSSQVVVEVKENNPEQQEPTPTGPRHELLSARESQLCQAVDLSPEHYLQIKKALIMEAQLKGTVLLQMDVIKRDKVVDFMIKAGWVEKTAGEEIVNS